MSGRIVCHFSCGAASAVATKLTLAKYRATHEIVIVNAFVVEEHEDNRRFLADAESWFDHPITVLRDKKYGASTREVFRRERYIKGPHGAPCTRALKTSLLSPYKQPGSTHVLGFTAEEADRYDDFKSKAGDDLLTESTLIDRGLGKADCLEMVRRAGIELPMMYRLGYNNANCIGCPKGGAGYWNKIRRDFPDNYEEMAQIQDDLGEGSYFLKGAQGGKRISLRELPPDKGRHIEPLPSCGFFCTMAEDEYSGEKVASGNAFRPRQL